MPTHNQNPGNFANNPQRAAEAGRIGGQKSSGNFANNPQRAAEAGRVGGQKSSGNFANNPERAAAAGRVGGQNSHGNRTDRTTEEETPKNRLNAGNRSPLGALSAPAGRNTPRDEY